VRGVRRRRRMAGKRDVHTPMSMPRLIHRAFHQCHTTLSGSVGFKQRRRATLGMPARETVGVLALIALEAGEELEARVDDHTR
jgi:hypothetical protein